MRWVITAVALVTAAPLEAQSVVPVDATVFVERSANGALLVEPASRLLRGDRVVTVLSWRAPPRTSYTITSAVPPGLSLESTSRLDLEVSTDGGRRWHVLADGRLPRGITHLRWQAKQGDGRFSYRAVVR